MRCIYRYRDGARCVWEGPTVMCPAHTLLDRGVQKRAAKQAADRQRVATEGIPPAIRRPPRQRDKFGQPSRVQSQREIIDKLPRVIGEPIDPTAPWCTCEGASADKAPCESCGKPHWLDWREAKCRVSSE